ncbi:MAG: creatininase family protein [Candidatus Thermoplasmatota archaeon]|jgi:creatinine amidohydrolase|nr:creatininase family protein [Candidatus Thermoplasmatota archaeon]MCL5963636.1 creatininase family protein [Candidatus Thermoplasmatota archaeon]
MKKFEELRSGQIEELDKYKTVIVIPVGSMEAHGPHLPVGSDMFQPLEILEELSKEEADLVVMPAIPYGVCYSTSKFTGTVGISVNALRSLVEDLIESLYHNGFRTILILSGHAALSHMSALKEAVYNSHDRMKGLKIAVLSDYDLAYKLKNKMVPEDDGHGGMLETSRIMVSHHNLIGELPDEHHANIPQFIIPGDITVYWKYSYSGNPVNASVELGMHCNDFIVSELKKLIAELRRM